MDHVEFGQSLGLLSSAIERVKLGLREAVPAYTLNEKRSYSYEDVLTPAPWTVMPTGCAALDDLCAPKERCAIYAPSFGQTVHHIAFGVSPKNAARVVACVNALGAFADEHLDLVRDGKAKFVLVHNKDKTE